MTRQQAKELHGVYQGCDAERSQARNGQASPPNRVRRANGKSYQANCRDQQERVRDGLRHKAQINPPQVGVETGIEDTPQKVEQRESAQKQSQPARQSVPDKGLPFLRLHTHLGSRFRFRSSPVTLDSTPVTGTLTFAVQRIALSTSFRTSSFPQFRW